MRRRVLIIGLGQIGMGYDLHSKEELVLTHAKAFSCHPCYDLIGGIDPDEKKRKLFESVYLRKAYPSLSAALENTVPDIVVICTPTSQHLNTISSIVNFFVPEAILCEKPLAYSVDESSAILKICIEHRIKLFVNYMRRSDSAVLEVKRRLSSGSIKSPVKGICWYSKGLINNGSHFINLLSYWLGTPVNIDVISHGRLWNEIDPEPDICIKFKLGTVVFLAAKEEYYSHYTIELISPSGRLYYENGGQKISWFSASQDDVYINYLGLSVEPEYIPSDFYKLQWRVVEELSKSLDGHKAYLCSGDSAFETIKTIETIRCKL